MEKILKLYTYVDGTNDTPFPSADEQVIIGSFTYTANRMGGAPTISATVKHRLCLDDIWNDKVYAEFNGEKYFIKNTPSSSKSNDDTRYEHDLQLLSEREVLSHVYFIDAVQGDSSTDTYKSNSTDVLFFGNLNQFVERLNDSMSYSGISYNAVVDDGVVTEDKQVQFTDQYISQALQQAFTLFEIPYYFVGKTIHFGHNEQAITTVLKYGHNDAFLSISKENANYQVINRITGTGSGDNIKYYYPNKSPKGDISARVESAGGITQADVHIENFEKFAAIDGSKHLSYESSEAEFVSAKYIKRDEENPNKNIEIDSLTMPLTVRVETFEAWQPFACELECLYKVTKGNALVLTVDILRDDASLYLTNVLEKAVAITEDGTEIEGKMPENLENNVHFSGLNEGKEYRFRFYFDFGVYSQNMFTVKFDTIVGDNGYWTYNGEEVLPEEFGLSVSGTPAIGDKIYMNVDHYIPTSQNLLPPIYRETLGANRFYNAQNNTYENEDGTFYEFENEYSPNNPMEGITAFEDIKPTIEGMTNNAGQPMNQFLEFAYDENDNDDIDPETNEYYHPYFFAKLPKYDGNYGFNLFDHAIEQQTMQISFTSGICGACTFEIGVGEETQKNIVQVGPSGALIRDEDGNVLWQNQEPQDVQNDTINNEVWIALKKDINTYPQIMPNVNFNYKPKPEDTFAILGIDLPEAYVIAAEDRLEKELIQYMWENNLEKFTFSAKFSRIFFEENPYVLSELTENSRVIIEYNGKQHTLYVDNYTYKMDEGQPLPEIEINLADTLAVGQNSLQATVEGVAQDVFYGLGGGDILRQGLRYFIRKDVPDTARERVAFLKGIDVGTYTQNSSGGTFRVLQDLRSYAEVDYLRVRVKAYFETLEIMNTNSVGGKMILTPGGGVYLREVVDRDDSGVWNYYRCYFLTQQDGRRIENRFHIGDLAISQSFNMTSGTTSNSANHYYWREVVGIGEDYIDLSKSICDTGSDVPMAEDTVCQLGNRSDEGRQGAIIFSAVDVFSPSITLYHGINDFSYVDKDYVSYGIDKTTGKAFFRVYGDSYTGARDQSTYVRYTPENGVEIRGRFLNRGGQDIEDVINNIEVEGSGIETWFYDPDPTLDNEPAVNWTTDEEKDKHIGDLYYSGKGKTYRFEKEGDTYVWRLIEDEDIQKAMEAANAANEAAEAAQDAAKDAQDTADSLKNFTDEAFADGIIDRSEAAAIEKYINSINETKKRIEGSYETLVNNQYLTNSIVKNALTTAYNEVIDSISSLTSTINTAISDNVTTEQEKASVDTAYAVFSDKVKAFDAAVENANEAIQDVLKGYSDQALQAAQDAMEAANDAKTAAGEVKNSVDALRNFTDSAFADGIISRSEAGGIASYINSIETFSKDVAESYNKVYSNPLLVGTDKTNLYNAYNAFNTAKNELVSTVNGVIADNVVDNVEKAGVDGKYAAFNTKYGDFVAAINAANKYIQDAINQNALQALQKIGELDYLKAALKEFTTIEGGLIQSSTLALGYTSDSGYQVMAGTNGIYDASKLGGGIASWWGGAMFDRFEYTEETMPKNVASALVRMDGTGYFAKGNLWWESDGTLHADPLSFFVGEDSVGDILGLFQFVKSDAGIEYVIPQYPFQKLEIGNYLQIGKAQLYWDEANQAFYVRHQDGVSPVGFYATGFISTKGANPDAGGTSGGGSTSLAGLTDVSLGTLQDGQVLRYDAASGKWVNGTGLSSVSLGDITDLHASWDALLKAAPSAYVTRWPTAAEVGALTQGTADGRYVNVTGDTMSGNLVVNATPVSKKGLVTFNNTAGGETYFYLQSAGTSYGAFTSNHSSYGTAIFDKTSSRYLGITAAGVPHFQGNTLLHAANYTSYTVTKTGGGASGTWGINVSGSAAVASRLSSTYTENGGNQPPSYFNGVGLKVNMMAIPVQYSDVVVVNGYRGGGYDVPYINAIAFQKTSATHGEVYHASGNYGASSWKTWYRFLDEYNYAGILDGRYVNVSGDTMTGKLTISAGINQMFALNSFFSSGEASISYQSTISSSNAKWVVGKGSWGTGNSFTWGIDSGTGLTTGAKMQLSPSGVLSILGNTVWHAGNDGSGSGLDADLLDSFEYSAFAPCVHYGTTATHSGGYYKISMVANTNWMFYFKVRLYQGYTFYDIDFAGYSYNDYHWHEPKARLISSSRESISVKFGYDGTNKMWVAVPASNYTAIGIYDLINGFTQVSRYNAFTITYQETLTGTTQSTLTLYRLAAQNENVASATKLQTARTLWGQSFNGTANVCGNMTGVGTIQSNGGVATDWGDTWSGGGTSHPWYGLSLNGPANQYQVTLSGYRGMTFHTSAGWLTMLNNGNVGIGTLSPGQKLHVEGVVYASTGMYSNGYVSALGQNSSDARLKTNIRDFNATTLIKQLHPKSFEWNDLAKGKFEVFRNTGIQYGLIAQEVRQVMPDIVEDNLIGSGYMGIRYEKLIPVVLKGLLENMGRLETAEERIMRLEKENRRLVKRIKDLERRMRE